MTRSDETVMTCPFDYSELRAYRACACVSLESDFSETIEVIITNLGAATDMRMNHVLIILTLTFVQVHTELNHEKNKRSIISETIQAMPVTFVAKIVRLKVYVTNAGPMTLAFTQGHSCVSNFTTF